MVTVHGETILLRVMGFWSAHDPIQIDRDFCRAISLRSTLFAVNVKKLSTRIWFFFINQSFTIIIIIFLFYRLEHEKKNNNKRMKKKTLFRL